MQQELDGSGCSGGYRAVWHTLKMEGIQVPREVVRLVLKELDPEGVSERRSKTLRRRVYHTPVPNHSWHVDGYNKLKPYGFPVHGCIDGYSRKVLWLKLLQEDLSSVQLHWNSHYIRKSRFDTISGRPDELYFLPECSGGRNYIKSVTDEQFDDMSQYCHEYNEDNLYQEYFGEIFEQLRLGEPTNWRECLDQYNRLCEIAEG
ncbi:Hypothetical predicted protein [Paramuricea clavata]|uniref:Integrase core domain-containing protein n=1 Tax=Paramuricea clavata TaxID=317549 RepID=A0A6S7GG81_PARCT|nr:Hypothetical predicted protein [Paramuricea clavata]